MILKKYLQYVPSAFNGITVLAAQLKVKKHVVTEFKKLTIYTQGTLNLDIYDKTN